MKQRLTPRPNLPRIHLKVNERNGVVIVLCKKSADMVWKVTEKIEEISCKHCESRVKKC